MAQEKLKAFANKQRIVTREKRVEEEEDPVPAWVREPDTRAPQISRANNSSSSSSSRPPPPNPTPIPVGHPYNLPPPAPPSTPRTTRRQMLQKEMSESLRRNLLWERQVSKTNLPGYKSKSRSNALAPLKPLTAAPNMVQLTVKKSGAPGAGPAVGGVPERERERERDAERKGSGGAQNEDEKKKKFLARNRSWAADDYHYAGW